MMIDKCIFIIIISTYSSNILLFVVRKSVTFKSLKLFVPIFASKYFKRMTANDVNGSYTHPIPLGEMSWCMGCYFCCCMHGCMAEKFRLLLFYFSTVAVFHELHRASWHLFWVMVLVFYYSNTVTHVKPVKTRPRLLLPLQNEEYSALLVLE